jgi:biotin transport system substrate-specific component
MVNNQEKIMNNKTHKMILVSLFAALTAIGAFIRIPVPPIPFTFQNFVVILSGLILGPKLAFASQAIYILIGLSGIPIFAYGGGIQYVLNPTFGYIIGFAALAYVTGFLMSKLKKASFINNFISSFCGLIFSYIIGVTYLYLIYTLVSHKDTSVSSVIIDGFLLFLPWDIVKIVVSSVIGREVCKRIKWIGANQRSIK